MKQISSLILNILVEVLPQEQAARPPAPPKPDAKEEVLQLLKEHKIGQETKQKLINFRAKL